MPRHLGLEEGEARGGASRINKKINSRTIFFQLLRESSIDKHVCVGPD